MYSSEKHTLCTGPLCLSKTRPSTLNKQCTYAACKPCCMVLSQAAAAPCRIWMHSKNKMPEADVHVSGYDTIRWTAPGQAEQVNPPRQSFARMLSPLHIKKLQDNDFQYNNAGQIEACLIFFKLLVFHCISRSNSKIIIARR